MASLPPLAEIMPRQRGTPNYTRIRAPHPRAQPVRLASLVTCVIIREATREASPSKRENLLGHTLNSGRRGGLMLGTRAPVERVHGRDMLGIRAFCEGVHRCVSGGGRTACRGRHRELRETLRAPLADPNGRWHEPGCFLGKRGEMVSPRLPQSCSAAARTAQPCGLYSVSPAVLGVSTDQLYAPSPTYSRERLGRGSPAARISSPAWIDSNSFATAR